MALGSSAPRFSKLDEEEIGNGNVYVYGQTATFRWLPTGARERHQTKPL